MAAKFDPIVLSWRGRNHVIPPNRVMGAIARIEDFVTMGELRDYGLKKTIPMGKLAQAFAAVIEYAGGKVDSDEVYADMFAGGEAQVNAAAAINALMGMMIPPESVAGKAQAAKPKSKGAAAVSRPSRRRTRQA